MKKRMEDVVTDNMDYIYNSAKSFTNDPDLANDLAHDAMYKAIKRKSTFTRNTNVRAWLYTIVRNTFINHHRRKKTVKDNGLSDADEHVYLNASRGSNYDRPDSQHTHKEIWGAIRSLKRDLSYPLEMFLRGYKYREIADMMDIPIGSVKSRIFSAKRAVKQKLL